MIVIAQPHEFASRLMHNPITGELRYPVGNTDRLITKIVHVKTEEGKFLTSVHCETPAPKPIVQCTLCGSRYEAFNYHYCTGASDAKY